MEFIYSNVCAADCRSSCRIKTKVQNGKIINIAGDPIDEYTLGSLCAKGYAQMHRVYSADRITHPMKQIGKGTGNWIYISWEQALREIGQRIIEIREKHNNLLPVCLNKYLGNMGILSKSVDGFFNSIGYITKMVDSPCVTTGIEALNFSFGASKKPTPEDMANAKIIVIWGGNPAWTATHQMRYVYAAKDKGATIVVIDPVLTATAARSDLYVQIKPGTDMRLALAIAKVLMEEDLLDIEFLNNYTHDWESFKAFLETIDLSELEDATEVPIEQIRNIAHLISKDKPMTIWLGAGVQHTIKGGNGFRVISALSAMTGNIGIAGGNIHYATYDAWQFAGVFEALKPPLKSSVEVISNENNGEIEHRYIGTGRYSELLSLKPPIELLWVATHNPVSQAPDSKAVKKALNSIDMVVVADQFLTSTAEYADYFLPVTTQYEQEDIVVSYWHYGAAVNQKAIDPIGESKSDFEIMRALAQLLNELSPGFSSFPVEKSTSEWLDLEMQPQYPKLGIKDYRELIEKYKRVNIPAVPWADKQFQTPSGKYEFPSVFNLDKVTRNEQYPFRLLRERSFSVLNSQFRHSNFTKGLSEKTSVIINRQVANSKDLEEGAIVKLYNQLGEIVLPVILSDAVPADVVVIHLGSDYKEFLELNDLIALIDTDLGDRFSDAKGLAFNNSYVDFTRA